MTDQLNDQKEYEQWLAERRDVSPPANLADQIMSQVVDLDSQRRNIWWLRVVQRIECAPVARWSVCAAALAIGALPFFFFASASSF